MPRGATQDRAGPMGRSVYDIATLLTYMEGWDAEDLMTTRGLAHFATDDLANGLTARDLKGRRIGVLREMIPTGPQHAEGVALFNRALDDMRKAGAQIIDPVPTGLDLRSLSTSAAGRTAEYEKLYVQNAYLERLGPNRPFKTIQEMIQKVGPAKFSKLMIDALSLEPPAQERGLRGARAQQGDGEAGDRRTGRPVRARRRGVSLQHAAAAPLGRLRQAVAVAATASPRTRAFPAS